MANDAPRIMYGYRKVVFDRFPLAEDVYWSVSFEVLMDNFGAKDDSDQAILSAFEVNRAAIHQKATEIAASGQKPRCIVLADFGIPPAAKR